MSYQATHWWRAHWREYIPDYRKEPELFALGFILADATSAEKAQERFGLAWPGISMLVQELGVKRNTVVELLRELARRGVIEIVPGAAPRTGDRGRPGNAYRFGHLSTPSLPDGLLKSTEDVASFEYLGDAGQGYSNADSPASFEYPGEGISVSRDAHLSIPATLTGIPEERSSRGGEEDARESAREDNPPPPHDPETCPRNLAGDPCWKCRDIRQADTAQTVEPGEDEVHELAMAIVRRRDEKTETFRLTQGTAAPYWWIKSGEGPTSVARRLLTRRHCGHAQCDPLTRRRHPFDGSGSNSAPCPECWPDGGGLVLEPVPAEPSPFGEETA